MGGQPRPRPEYPWATILTLLFCSCGPQLLRIEEELGDAAVYAGENYRHIPIA